MYSHEHEGIMKLLMMCCFLIKKMGQLMACSTNL